MFLVLVDFCFRKKNIKWFKLKMSCCGGVKNCGLSNNNFIFSICV